MFLNAAIAGGLAAALAPIIIHIVHRRKIRMVDWGAMRFLVEMIRRSRRQLFLEHWLLLAVRMAVLVCLVLALMRPALAPPSLQAGAGGFVRRGRVAAVLLIDDSASTAAGRGETLLEGMKRLALAYVDTLEKGDEISVLRLSELDGGESDPLFDHEAARALIRNVAPTGLTSDIPALLEAGLVQLTRHLNPEAELVLVTDGGVEGWHPDARARWADLVARMAPEEEEAGRQGLRLVCLMPEREAAFENISVPDLRLDRSVVPVDQPLGVRVVVNHTGTHVPRGMRIRLLVDERAVAERALALAPGARQDIVFHHTFREPGSHAIEAQILGAHDALKRDDRRALAVEAQHDIPVLLVEQRPVQGLGGALGFLRLALQPEERGPGLFQMQRVGAGALSRTDLSAFRVVVFGDLSALDAASVAAVERFVAAGGGLLIGLGEGADPELVNRFWARQGDGFLPCPLAAVEAPGAPLHPSTYRAGHPAFIAFSGDAAEAWKAARIERYFGLDTRPVAPDELQVLMGLSNGAPLVVERARGQGRVILVTTALDVSWSDLPLQAAYVPLVRGLVSCLAGQVQPLRHLVPGARLSHIARTGVPQAETAGGESLPLRPGAWEGKQAYVSEPLAATGVYRVREQGRSRPVYYSVALDAAESRLAPLDAAERKRLLGRVRPAVLRREEALVAMLEAGRRQPRELWQWFLAAALGLLFVETLLTRRQAVREQRSAHADRSEAQAAGSATEAA